MLAANRKENAGSYVAGGLALNHRFGTPRFSRDIDIFHDSTEALLKSWRADRELLMASGYTVRPLREWDSFVEAWVCKDGERTEIQWGVDSAYRFFPLIEDDTVGYTLHPVDLAANKLCALVGRSEPRDWIDVLTAMKELQPMAYLLSAACGKDPGFSPTSMLEFVARRRYNQVEIDEKITPKGVYDAAELSRFWHAEIERAREMVRMLPRDKAGMCLLDKAGNPYKGGKNDFASDLALGAIVFHEGRIRGAWPRIIG